MKIRYLLLIIFVIPLITFGQEVQFVAKAPDIVRVGEQFVLSYTADQKVSDFKYPDMEGFTILSGPNTSTSSNFQFINGKQQRSTSITYTFYLRANAAGAYTIKPATITFEKKTYASNAVQVQVVQQNNQQNQQSNQQNQQQSQQNQQSRGSTYNNTPINKNDLFITSEVNKREVYIGEQIVMSHKIYTKVDIAGFGDVKFPSYTGFWKEDVELDNIQLSPTTYNGQTYYSDEMQRNILFPQKSGEITIPAAEIEVIAKVKTPAQQRRGVFGDPFFDDFFSTYQNVSVLCTTTPITIKSKPLPTEGKLASFSGAVGNFSISATIDKTELKANEAITLKYTISGSGNIRLIDKVDVKFPSDFEVYKPKITQNIKTNANSVSGNKVFEYVIIPRNSGSFKINSFDFSYFDPNKKTYVTLHTPEFNVEVEDAGVVGGGNSVVNTVAREDVVTLGEDIRYINSNIPDFEKKTSVNFGSSAYYVIIGSITLLVLLLTLGAKIMIKKRNDTEYMRRKHAEAIAMKRLKRAKILLDSKQQDKFYDELSNAMWKFISDKFNINNAELNRDYLQRLTESGKLDEEDVNKFVKVLDNAEYARFAPDKSADSMSEIYTEAIEAIKTFDTKLK